MKLGLRKGADKSLQAIVMDLGHDAPQIVWPLAAQSAMNCLRPLVVRG